MSQHCELQDSVIPSFGNNTETLSKIGTKFGTTLGAANSINIIVNVIMQNGLGPVGNLHPITLLENTISTSTDRDHVLPKVDPEDIKSTLRELREQHEPEIPEKVGAR